ncbi:hypothetical protein OKW31_000257 [Paraburkholderia atlantica]
MNGKDGSADDAAHDATQQFDLFGMPVEAAVETPAVSRQRSRFGRKHCRAATAQACAENRKSQRCRVAVQR